MPIDSSIDALPRPFQHLVLELLCFDDVHGAEAAARLTAEHFDNVYRDFARRVLAYRTRHGRPPGHNYIDSLAAEASRPDPIVKNRLLPELHAAGTEGVNGPYVLSRLERFMLEQKQKAALFAASEEYQRGGEDRTDRINKIFSDVLAFRAETMDAGLFLDDTEEVLRQLEMANPPALFPMGIPALDYWRVGVHPGEMLLYIAPKNSGKTWFCIHMAKRAMMNNLHVLHVSLEMSQRRMVGRYAQALFGVARSSGQVRHAEFIYDETAKDKVIGYKMMPLTPKGIVLKDHGKADPRLQRNFARMEFMDKEIDPRLRRGFSYLPNMYGRLVIKAFPTRQLTMSKFISYLDYLEKTKRFVPKVVIVDYPDLMFTDPDNYRLSLGDNFENLRGVAVDRNFGIIAPTQGQRKTIGAKRVRSGEAAEDIRKVNVSDTVLTFSRTREEERIGLGRLTLEHARDAPTGMEILLSQSYTIGQYVLESTELPHDHFDLLEGLTGKRGEEDE